MQKNLQFFSGLQKRWGNFKSNEYKLEPEGEAAPIGFNPFGHRLSTIFLHWCCADEQHLPRICIFNGFCWQTTNQFASELNIAFPHPSARGGGKKGSNV